MSGHSQFSNIKHRKGLQDSKKSKNFAKISKEITVAVRKGGKDINFNSALRTAIEKAKNNNMSKSTYLNVINQAIKAGNNDDFMEIKYEGYGPGGIAFIIECITNNNKRTVANIKSYFNKTGGSLGLNNSVSYLFSQQGVLEFYKNNIKEEKILEWVVENNCLDFETKKDTFIIKTEINNFDNMRKFLEKNEIDSFVTCEILWIPIDKIKIEENLILDKINSLIDLLKNDDDVKNVYYNLK